MADNKQYAYRVIGDWREYYVFRYNTNRPIFEGTLVASFSDKNDADTYVKLKNGKVDIIEFEDLTDDFEE